MRIFGLQSADCFYSSGLLGCTSDLVIMFITVIKVITVTMLVINIMVITVIMIVTIVVIVVNMASVSIFIIITKVFSR